VPDVDDASIQSGSSEMTHCTGLLTADTV
jgi:hypothetical protein